MLDEVAAVVGDGIDVIEVVFVIPFHFEFGTVHGTRDDGVQLIWMAEEVVLNDRFGGGVLVFGKFAVAPPNEGGGGASFFAQDSATEGVVAVFDGISAVIDFGNSVVEVVGEVVFYKIDFVVGEVATGVVGGGVSGDAGELIVAIVIAVLGDGVDGG